MKLNVDGYLNSEWEKYCEEQGCDLTEDDLTLLGEHMKKQEQAEQTASLYDIALVKSYEYSQEYNRHSGQVEDKEGYPYLKQGYIAGFMAGFAHKMGGGHGGD